MRSIVVGVALVLSAADTAAAQTARCELSPRPYGLGGICRLDPAQPGAGNAPHIPFADSVRIWMTSGPRDLPPWRGNISLPRLETSFEIAEVAVGPSERQLVFRTGVAWLPVREWRETDSTATVCAACDRSAKTVSLIFDLAEAPRATEDDIAILRAARAGVDGLAPWNREEEQVCRANPSASIGLFCLLYSAVEAEAGRYHHRQPALQIVRAVIMERWRERVTSHTLVDFNNHPATTIGDLRSALDISLARAQAQAQPPD